MSLITKIKKWALLIEIGHRFFLFLIYKFSTLPEKMTMLSFLTLSMLRRYLDTWMPSHSRWILARWQKRSPSPSTDLLMNFPYVTLFFEGSSQLSTNLFGLQEDFRLMISNAKTFNPPGMIYHTEADRIEVWASDHIFKVASCVIEYEIEWNVDVDWDEDVNVNADEDPASDGPDTLVWRSPSVLSASVPLINWWGRERNAVAKKESILSETLESDGHLPGFKDGVDIFLPASDWAEAMLALKLKGAVFFVTSFLASFHFSHDPNHTFFFFFVFGNANSKGKRYWSKKERLHMERGSPPYATDGSLDYAESEFLGILSCFCLEVFEFKFEFADTVVLVTYSGRPVQYTFCLASHLGLMPACMLAPTVCLLAHVQTPVVALFAVVCFHR